MVPDKFDMVDMGGIDLIESQGVVVEGLYQRLVESIALCRYQCLYNWKFDGILIPPSYVEMIVRGGSVWINEGVNVDVNDVVHISSIEPAGPEIEPLTVTENGEYYTPVGIDGYNPVNVSVPRPVLNYISIIKNGSYSPEQGVDGFSLVTVDVPSESAVEFRTARPLNSEGANGDICAVYRAFIAFRFFRLTISRTRSSGGMQMSEIKFLKDGSEVPTPSGTTIISTGAPYSQSETVDKLIDGSVDTKYYTTSVPVAITIEFPSEVDYTEWEWYTANDSTGRDPSAFSVEVSADGNNWVSCDSISGFDATQSRKVLAYQGNIQNSGVYEVLIKENGSWVNIMGYLPE